MSRHSFLYLIFFSIVCMTCALDTQSPHTENDLSENIRNWKPKAIYQILTDRFNNLESNAPCEDFWDYCGGTFQGIISKLDYIKSMGFDAIWISPVVQNSEGGYHGYWALDFKIINHRYGGYSGLKNLVTAAHNKGISVMVDVVANHVGRVASNYSLVAPPLNNPSNYHKGCVINYSDQWSIENCRIGSLADLNTEDPTTIAFLYDWVKWLVKEFAFDAIRIDTVKHVPKLFWPGYVESSGVFAMGEIFHGDPAYVGPYQDYMPSVFNYPMYYTIRDVFNAQMDMHAIPERLDQNRKAFRDTSVLGVFIDNHDNPRFLNASSDQSLLKNALVFAMLTEGIPVIYYGTEQGFAGRDDPSNREPLWTSGFNQDNDVYRLIAAIFSRGNLIVAVSNQGTKGSFIERFQLPSSNSKVLRNALKDEMIRQGDDGYFTLSISNGEPKIYYIE